MTSEIINIKDNRLMVKLLKLTKKKYLQSPTDDYKRSTTSKYTNICSALTTAGLYMRDYDVDTDIYGESRVMILVGTMRAEIAKALGEVAYFSVWWGRLHDKNPFSGENRQEVQRLRHIWIDHMIRTYEHRIKEWEKANAKAG